MLAAFKMKKWQVSTDPHVRQIKKSQVPTGPRIRKKLQVYIQPCLKGKKNLDFLLTRAEENNLQVDSGPPLKGTNYKFILGRV